LITVPLSASIGEFTDRIGLKSPLESYTGDTPSPPPLLTPLGRRVLNAECRLEFVREGSSLPRLSRGAQGPLCKSVRGDSKLTLLATQLLY
jgi:hypothetical protein